MSYKASTSDMGALVAAILMGRAHSSALHFKSFTTPSLSSRTTPTAPRFWAAHIWNGTSASPSEKETEHHTKLKRCVFSHRVSQVMHRKIQLVTTLWAPVLRKSNFVKVQEWFCVCNRHILNGFLGTSWPRVSSVSFGSQNVTSSRGASRNCTEKLDHEMK